MKTATASNGKPVEACEEAPKEATCPYCEGVLTLRSRRAMNNGKVTYYWRHLSNENFDCVARKRPVR